MIILKLRERLRRTLRMTQQMRERCLLRTDQQQRQQHRKKRAAGKMEKALHGASIKTHAMNLINLDQQTLQILALGKLQCHRMIGTALQALDDARAAARIQCRTGNDFLEQLQTNAA